MAFPMPLLLGSFVFVLIGVLLGQLGKRFKTSQRLTHDESQIYCVVVVRVPCRGAPGGACGLCSAG